MQSDTVSLTPSQMMERAGNLFTQTLGGVHPEGLVPWDELGLTRPDVLDGKYLKNLNHDQRRGVLDSLQNISLLPVYEGNRFVDREKRLEKIAPEVGEAKWHYMLCLVNETYDLGLDETDAAIIAPLLNELSVIERGATNPLMPTTHKLRHNPSIHSLHVAGVIHDIFDKARGLVEDEAAAVAELTAMEKQLQRCALVHDMGELLGELSVASDRTHMTAEQVKAFEAARGLSETQVFMNALHNKVGELKAKQWPATVLDDKYHQWEHDYEVSEDASAFLGRLHKVCERVQSQQDYLRFEGRDFAPNMRTASGSSKHFMMNYVQEPLHGVSRGSKNKPSLDELASEFENPRVAKAVMEAVHQTVEHLQDVLQARMDYRLQTHRDRLLENLPQAGGMAR